jgi:hypothetical protein
MRSAGFAGSSRAGRAVLSVVVLSVPVAAGCGAKDFPNDPRAPAPIEVSAKVSSKEVVVSPKHFGAGLVDFTIANLSNSPIRFEIKGPTDASTGTVQPGLPAELKAVLDKGNYVASAGDGSSPKPDTLHVGPPRKTAQNKLLLP